MKKFITERWYLHLIFGGLIVTPFIWLLLKTDPSFVDTGKIFQCIVAGFSGLALGFMWEWWYVKYHEAPFDKWDVIFTILGAILGTILL
jgi:uncharacterized membrane protein